MRFLQKGDAYSVTSDFWNLLAASGWERLCLACVYFGAGAAAGVVVRQLNFAYVQGIRPFITPFLWDWRCLLLSGLNGALYFLFAANVQLHLTAGLLLQLFLTSALLLHSAIDYDCLLLPDALTLLIFIGGAAYAHDSGNLPEALLAAFAAALAMYLLYKCSGGMGLGDVKLAAALVLWLGAWEKAALFLLLVFVMGGAGSLLLLLSGYKKRGEAVPFGPFLALAALIMLLYGDRLCLWYWQRLLAGR